MQNSIKFNINKFKILSIFKIQDTLDIDYPTFGTSITYGIK